MPAPLAAAVLARSRIVRRLAVGASCAAVVTVGVIFAPLFTIPLALAGTGASAAVDATAAGPTVIGEWGYPYSGKYHRGRGFGHNPVRGCSFCSTNHKGADISQGCGSTIYAAGPGRVTIAGSHHGWGNTVIVDHGGGLHTLYGHMQWGSIRVSVGDHVAVGTALGSEGNTGRSFGCHLHYEVRVDGTAIDPYPFMAARGLPLG